MSFKAPPPPRGKRDMLRDLEQAERKKPINMTDHDLKEESYNIAVQRNKNWKTFTKEREARSKELFNEESNREYTRTYGHRPPPEALRRSRELLGLPAETVESLEQKSPRQQTETAQQPTEIEREAKTVMDFTQILNNPKTKARGTIIPR